MTSHHQPTVRSRLPALGLASLGAFLPVPRKGNRPLPEGWQEMKDVATGTVYYYNGVTGATSWGRPTGEAV